MTVPVDGVVDLTFVNAVLDEARGLIVYAFVALIFVGGYALVAFFQCRKNTDVRPENKTGWLVFIALSPFMYGIGAAVYGLVHYKQAFKIVPVVFLIGILIFSLKMMDKSFDMVANISVATIEESVSDDRVRVALIQDIDVLRDEASFFGKGRNSLTLLSHIMGIVPGADFDAEDYEAWRDLFEQRKSLSQFGMNIEQFKSAVHHGIREATQEEVNYYE